MPVIHVNDPAKPDDAIYIGRVRGGLGEWGNPFTHEKHVAAKRSDLCLVADRDEAVESYRRDLWERIQNGTVSLEALAALDGKTLACWCAPKRCHGHVLEAAAAWAVEQLDQTGASDCPVCGSSPCYHICPNSEAYYSPEQERADEPFYGMDDHAERYAAEAADLILEGEAEFDDDAWDAWHASNGAV